MLTPRLCGLCDRLTRAGMDAALLLHPRDVLYYAGCARPASLLVVPGGSPPERGRGGATLFVRRALSEVRAEATVPDVLPMKGLSTIARQAGKWGLESGVVGVELDTTSAELRDRVGEAFGGWRVEDVTPLVLGQRAVKDEDEIAATRRAASAADAGHVALAKVAAGGLRELELVAEVERAMRLAGHEGYQPLRRPGARGGGMLLMSGDNLLVRGGHGLVVTGAGLSAATPYGPSRRVVQPGDLIVLDTGSTCDGYTADESRTYVVGQPTPAQRALFDATARAEEAVLEAGRPEVPVADLHAAAKRVIEQGAGSTFPPGSLKLPGFVGHGIGLELDEPPVLWDRQDAWLREGMVLAIEVEVSAPGQGMMAKMEDTVVVRSDGVELLTHARRQLMVCDELG